MKKKATLIIFLVILIGLVTVICSCKDDPQCKFEVGEIVVSIIGNKKGMIIYRYEYYNTCSYDIRFCATELQTNTKLLSEDDPISASTFSTVYMKEFEIKKE